MDGLEIREALLSDIISNKDARIDSQFYTQQANKNNLLRYQKIGNILLNSQYGISISMNENNIGYPIYRMNEIHNMLCDLDVNKCANITIKEAIPFILNDRDVVFNRTNSLEWVGRTGLFRKSSNKDFIFASYLVRFIPDGKIILPEYLTTFLNSKFGVQEIKRRARQSINQTNVNPEEVKSIEIPLLSLELQNKIKTCFDIAFKKIIAYTKLYQEAENLLLEELGLTNFNPNTENISIRKLSDSFCTSGRIDSEYYQPKYEELERAIKNNYTGYDKLSAFVENYSTGYPYESGRYLESGGVPLIRINNIDNGNLDISNAVRIPYDDLSLSPKDIATQNDILISMSGTIGNSCKIPAGIRAVINQRIMRITSKGYNNEVLPLIINSLIGKLQLDRIGTGGVQTNISAKDILNIYIPILPNHMQIQIENKIKNSFQLKEQSQQLLELAKCSVELSIEQDEDTACDYITEHSQKYLLYS